MVRLKNVPMMLSVDVRHRSQCSTIICRRRAIPFVHPSASTRHEIMHLPHLAVEASCVNYFKLLDFEVSSALYEVTSNAVDTFCKTATSCRYEKKKALFEPPRSSFLREDLSIISYIQTLLSPGCGSEIYKF